MGSSMWHLWFSVLCARRAFASISLRWEDPPITVDPNPLVDTIIGCWPLEVVPIRYQYDLFIPEGQRQPMSLEVCSKVCRKVSKFYSVLGGDTCFCTPFIRSELIPSQGVAGCDMPCAGNVAEMCGGKETVSVYEIAQRGGAPPPPPPPCPCSRFNFDDFTDYDITCETGAKSRRFRKVAPHLGQFLDLIVETVDASGANTASSMLNTIKGIGLYLDFLVLKGETLSVRMYFVSSGTETRQLFHNVSFAVYDIGASESVKTKDFTNYEVGHSVTAEEGDGVTCTSLVDGESDNPNTAVPTPDQRSHSALFNYVDKEEVVFHFSSPQKQGHIFVRGFQGDA